MASVVLLFCCLLFIAVRCRICETNETLRNFSLFLFIVSLFGFLGRIVSFVLVTENRDIADVVPMTPPMPPRRLGPIPMTPPFPPPNRRRKEKENDSKGQGADGAPPEDSIANETIIGQLLV